MLFVRNLFSYRVVLSVLFLLSTSAAHAQSTSLEMTINGGQLPSLHRSSRPTQRLSSRGSRGRSNLRQKPTKAPVVLGKLATIIVPSVALRVSQDSTSRVLSVANQGTHIAVVSDTGEYLGVLMIDRSIGWIPRNSAELIDYQVAVSRTPDDSFEGSTGTENQNEQLGDQMNDLAVDSRTRELLRTAFSYLGVPYVWAGNTRAGLDCSAFLKNVFATQGINLPRHSGDQARVGTAVRVNGLNDMHPGDRLYFDMKHRGQVSHCGIYLGNSYFIHASSNHGKVDVDSIYTPSYHNALVAVRRSF